MEEGSNACNILGVTYHIKGSVIGSFTYGSRRSGKYKGWSEKGVYMYSKINEILMHQRGQHNKCTTFKITLRANFCNVRRMKKRNREEISATHDIDTLKYYGSKRVIFKKSLNKFVYLVVVYSDISGLY